MKTTIIALVLLASMSTTCVAQSSESALLRLQHFDSDRFLCHADGESPTGALDNDADSTSDPLIWERIPAWVGNHRYDPGMRLKNKASGEYLSIDPESGKPRMSKEAGGPNTIWMREPHSPNKRFALQNLESGRYLVIDADGKLQSVLRRSQVNRNDEWLFLAP
jgi:hypothetical protein